MTEFEVLLVPLSLILGIGITKILGGYVSAVRARKHATTHWVPIIWSITILAYNIGYFNVLYDIHITGQPWTWMLYGSTLFQVSLLYFSAGMIFPSSEESMTDMLKDFSEHGRLALVPVGILLATAPILNYVQTPGPFDLVEVANVTLTAILVAYFASKSVKVQYGITVLFAILTMLCWLFLWARPG